MEGAVFEGFRIRRNEEWRRAKHTGTFVEATVDMAEIAVAVTMFEGFMMARDCKTAGVASFGKVHYHLG